MFYSIFILRVLITNLSHWIRNVYCFLCYAVVLIGWMDMTSSTMPEIREFASFSETITPFLTNGFIKQLPWGMRPRILRNAGLKFAVPKSNVSGMFAPTSSYSDTEGVYDSQGDFLGTTIEQLVIASQTLGVLRWTLYDWESKIMQKENLIKFDTIYQGDITLILNVPLEVEPFIEDGEYILSIPELNIYVSAPTLGEAEDELQSDIIWLWREYVDAQNEDFTSDAEELREKLQKLVKGVR